MPYRTAPLGGAEPFSWPMVAYESIVAGVLTQFAPAVCVSHRGAHAVYLGACVAFKGRGTNPRAVRRCEEPGCGEPAEWPHEHPRALSVRLDEDALASAIVRASAATRQQRREEERKGQAALPKVPSLRKPDETTRQRYTPLPLADDAEKQKSGGFEP